VMKAFIRLFTPGVGTSNCTPLGIHVAAIVGLSSSHVSSSKAISTPFFAELKRYACSF
jgi:hypothetical protein